MRITVEVPARVFRKPKTPEQVAEEMRRAAALFWVARGDVAPEAMSELTAPPPKAKEPMLYDLLLQGPDVGEDADFERSRPPGRELPIAPRV